MSQHTLSPSHRKMLEGESSINASLIQQRGYWTATKPEELTALGFTEEQAKHVPALVIPIYSVDGEVIGHQTRPDKPRTNKSGKLVKYEIPAGWSMRLDIPPAVRKEIDDPSMPLWITEGAKKADSAAVRGLCCIDLIGVWNFRGMNEKGGSVELADWDRIAIKGRTVYIAFDSDVMTKAPVRAALQRLAGLLKRRGARVVLPVVIPTKQGEKVGLDDWFASGGTPRGLTDAVDYELLRGSHIQVNNRNLASVTEDALQALMAANYPPSVFVRAGELVRIVTDERDVPKIKDLSMAAVRGVLARSATWIKSGKDDTEVAPPKEVVEDMMALGSWPNLPPLIAVTRAPVLSKDGTLSMSAGYCPKSHMYVAANEDWPEWAESTTEAARFLQEDVLGDFPFAGQSDRAHAVALMLLPIVRPVISGPTPLHLVDAPSPGTGKSLLAKICLMPTQGNEISLTVGTKDEEEWRKKIASSLLDGRAYVFLDNLSRKVDSASLAGVLTATEWNDRGLSTMSNINAPVRCIWVATANNAEMSTEITRRAVYIRLDAKVERPEDRTEFAHPNIEEWVQRNRAKIVSALCALVRSWTSEGQPLYSGTRIGSYEDWGKVIGGILQCAGIEGFLGNIQELRAAADSDESSWAAFYERWAREHQQEPVRATDLLALFESDDVLAGLLGDKSESSKKTRLGFLIKKRVGVVSSGYRVERIDGERANGTRYRLAFLTGKPSKPSSLFDQPSEDDLDTNLDGLEGLDGYTDPHAHAHAHTHAPAKNSPQPSKPSDLEPESPSEGSLSNVPQHNDDTAEVII